MRYSLFKRLLKSRTHVDLHQTEPVPKCLQNANGVPALVDNGSCYSREPRTVDDTVELSTQSDRANEVLSHVPSCGSVYHGLSGETIPEIASYEHLRQSSTFRIDSEQSCTYDTPRSVSIDKRRPDATPRSRHPRTSRLM